MTNDQARMANEEDLAASPLVIPIWGLGFGISPMRPSTNDQCRKNGESQSSNDHPRGLAASPLVIQALVLGQSALGFGAWDLGFRPA
jgi:hypothetical protein